MVINVTSRHFKAHESVVEYAEGAVASLSRFYDGIVKSEVIMSYEKARNSVKIVEVNVSVYGAVLTSIVQSDDFFKSIDGAVEKVKVQLKKYKAKLRAKDRKTVRKVQQKV